MSLLSSKRWQCQKRGGQYCVQAAVKEVGVKSLACWWLMIGSGHLLSLTPDSPCLPLLPLLVRTNLTLQPATRTSVTFPPFQSVLATLQCRLIRGVKSSPFVITQAT